MTSFLKVSLTARPARLAVAVPDSSLFDNEPVPAWRDLCMEIFAFLGRVWGGAGMAIIPVGVRGVESYLLRALAQYDPDFVVPFRHRSLGHEWIPQEARDQLALHLSAPDPLGSGDAPHLVCDGPPDYPLTDIDVFATDFPEPAALQVEGDDDVALLVAARVGVLTARYYEQHVEAGRTPERLTADASNEYGLLHLAYSSRPLPADGWRSPEFQERLPLPRTMHGCSYLMRPAGIDAACTVVVGDELSDFAFALLLDRMYGPGSGMWLPSRFVNGGDSSGLEARVATVQALARPARGRRAALITSTTADRNVLERTRTALSETLGSSGTSPWDLTPVLPADAVKILDPILVPLPSPALLVDPHRISLPQRIPFTNQLAQNEVVPPIPRVAESLPAHKVRWHTDAMIDDVAVPPRVALNHMTADPLGLGHIRAGRDGATWMSATALIGAADIARVHNLERPTLHEPDAYVAIETLLSRAGWAAEPSNVAGFYLGTAKLWGSLDRLAADLRNPIVSGMLNAFIDPASSFGIVPGTTNRRVMRLPDIRKAVGWALDVPQARELLERLAARGILTRGFALKCARCRNADFYRVDDTGQLFTCTRCSERNSPTGKAWPLATPGPAWFYRLDELVHQAMTQGLAGPILALDGLRRASRGAGMRWTVAVDVFDAAHTRITDLDFVVIIGNKLAIGEAKTNGSMGATAAECEDQLRKLREIAEAVAADYLILATTTDGWNQRSTVAANQIFRRPWRPELVITTVDDMGAVRAW